MHRLGIPFSVFGKSYIRKYADDSAKKITLRYVDKNKNLVYGGDLPITPSVQTIGTLLFDRLRQKNIENEILQVCTATKYGLTRKKCLEKAIGLAKRLQEEGIKQGDCVILVGNNSLNMNTALTGIFLMGAVPFPVTHKINIDEFIILMKNTQPKFCGCDRQNLVSLRRTIQLVNPEKTSKIFLLNQNRDPSDEDVECFAEFIGNRDNDVDSFQPAIIKNPGEDRALILKGLRDGIYGKGIAITHRNLNHVIARFEATPIEEHRKNVIIMVQKITWMSGIYSLFLSCLFGSKLIVMDEFDEEKFMRAIEEYKVTTGFLYTSKLWQLYKYNYPREYDLSSCQFLQAYDGNLSPVLVSGMKEKLGLKLKHCFGLNELCGLVLINDDLEKTASAGKLVPSLYGKVISNKSLQKVGPLHKGEICFKGPVVAKGYINDEEASRRLFDKDGYFLSGLYGFYDENGNFFIIDKIYFVIKYKDHKISPRELEGIIKTMEPVKDAIVGGISNPRDGYYPIAFVVLQKGQKVTAEEIMAYVNAKVEDHKRLRGGIVFVPKIPRTRDTGSLKRNVLKKILSKYSLNEEVTEESIRQSKEKKEE